MGHFDFVVSLLIFIGLPLLLTAARRDSRSLLKRHGKTILLIALLGMILTLPDYLAVRWGAWSYNPAKNLPYEHFFQPETVVGAAMTYCFGGLLTTMLAEAEDRRSASSKKRRSRKPLWLWPRTALMGFAGSKR